MQSYATICGMAYEWTTPPADMPARLRAARAYADISQKDMATKLGVDRATIRNWEQGRTTPKGHALRGLLEDYIQHTGIDRAWFETKKLNITKFIADRPESRAGEAEKKLEAGLKAKKELQQSRHQDGPETRQQKAADR